MLRTALLLTTALYAPASLAASCGAVPNYAAKAGGFATLDGQMYAPDGTPFRAHGINVMEFDRPSAAQILAADPGTNFVRLAIYDYASPASLAPYIADLTSHGIFVEIEDHSNTDGSNAGGGKGAIFSGARLQQQLAWISDIGAAFKTNPYVGMGSNNEPSERVIDSPGAALDPAALSAWQAQEYAAFRKSGNNSPFWLEVNGWADPASFARGNPAAYANMTNVRFDVHIYPWLFRQAASEAQVKATIASFVASAQQIKSADGTIGVDVLEYGNSTTGGPPVATDQNWRNVVNAIQSSGLGTAAFSWGNGSPGNALNGSEYGAMVAGYLATSGASGCALSPLPSPIATPAMLAATRANTAANALSVADVANLATQGLTGDGQSLVEPFASAGGVAPGGALVATDPTTAAVLAAGPALGVAPIVRVEASPIGTMPTPAPVTGSTTFAASGDDQTVIPAPGNASGSVTGSRNTINATGGIQTITVTGPGNSIATGPYDDTITVQSGGNTISTGGGRDTVVLAYGGKPSTGAINADLPAAAPLSSAGNIIIAPAPGTGVLTIVGTLSALDRIDVTKALAGLPGFNGTNVWHFLTASTSAQGCILSVSGQPIVVLPNGSPSGNIGSFVIASGSGT